MTDLHTRFRPSQHTHWAVILNRGYVRATIIRIRRARRGGVYTAGADAVFLKRLVRDWKLYRFAMLRQESQRRTARRRTARGIQTTEKMFDAIIGPMIRGEE